MTLQIAKARRIEALQNRDADRVMIEPAAHHSQFCRPKSGSAAEYVIDALAQGTSIDLLSAETGWPRATVVANLYRLARKSGIGIRKRDGRLHLMLPPGVERAGTDPRVVYASGSVPAEGPADRIIDISPL